MPWKDNYTTSDEKTLSDDQLEWPGGKLCSLITIDLSLATKAVGVTEQDLATDRAMFGLGEGFETIKALLDNYGLKATFAVPAVMAASYGDRLVELQSAGHEIAVHGLRHEDLTNLTRTEELERIQAATEMVTAVTGRAPAGWYSLPRSSDPFAVGTVSPQTIDLLAASEYLYFCPGLADDIPYYWVADFDNRKSVLTMPYYYHFDDHFFLMFPSRGTGLEHADVLYANWRAEFDAQLERGRCFSMILHPHAVGWSNRQRKLDRFFEHMANSGELWNPTSGECASYWLDQYPADKHLKLTQSIWQDHEGSLS